MNWVDYLIITIIGLSVLIGLWRGLLREVVSVATWIAAFTIAFLFAQDAAAYLPPTLDIPSLRVGVAFSGLFLTTLILGWLVGILASRLVDYTNLQGVDRVLGMAFGMVRGAAVITLLVMMAGVTPLPKDPWWQQAHLIRHFQSSALWLRGFLPPELAQYIRFN